MFPFFNFLFLFMFSAVFSAKISITKKVEALRKLKQPLIFTDKNYTDYCLDDYRSYGLYVLFSIRSKKYKCRTCVQAVDAMNTIAMSYERAFSEDLFFAIAIFEDNQNAYNTHQLETAPILSYFPPTTVLKGDELAKALRPEYTIMHDIDNEAIVKHVEKLSHIKISIYYTPESLKNLSIGITIVFTLLVVVMSSVGYTWKEIYESKQIWRILCLVVYGVGVSGLVYCVINKPPLYHDHMEEKNWKKKIILFGDSSDFQTIGEGLVMGSLNLLSLLLVVSLKGSNKVHGYSIRNCINVLVASIWLVDLYEIYTLYSSKNHWYDSEITRFNREGYYQIKKQVSWRYVTKRMRDMKSSFQKLSLQLRKLF